MMIKNKNENTSSEKVVNQNSEQTKTETKNTEV